MIFRALVLYRSHVTQRDIKAVIFCHMGCCGSQPVIGVLDSVPEGIEQLLGHRKEVISRLAHLVLGTFADFPLQETDSRLLRCILYHFAPKQRKKEFTKFTLYGPISYLPQI